MGNKIIWADVPVKDLTRAKKFYEAVLGISFEEKYVGVAAPAHGEGEASFCLYDINKTDPAQKMSLRHEPSDRGIQLYFPVSNVQEAIKIVESKGGKVLDTQDIPWGNRAIILDSEGNRIALFTLYPPEKLPQF